jgi:hypothetical protein
MMFYFVHMLFNNTESTARDERTIIHGELKMKVKVE